MWLLNAWLSVPTEKLLHYLTWVWLSRNWMLYLLSGWIVDMLFSICNWKSVSQMLPKWSLQAEKASFGFFLSCHCDSEAYKGFLPLKKMDFFYDPWIYLWDCKSFNTVKATSTSVLYHCFLPSKTTVPVCQSAKLTFGINRQRHQPFLGKNIIKTVHSWE